MGEEVITLQATWGVVYVTMAPGLVRWKMFKAIWWLEWVNSLNSMIFLLLLNM